MDKPKRQLIWHAIGVTLLLAIMARGLMAIPWLEGFRSFAFALLAIYLPLWLLRYKGWPLDFVERTGPRLIHSLSVMLAAAAIIFPLYFAVAHLWQVHIWHMPPRPLLRFWPGWNFLMTQVILVALPEEFFYRGYLQGVLDRAFGRPWRLLGAQIGWGWIVAALLFAVSHTIAAYQWWHFAIFFPGLLFGYLRARTNGLLAPIGIHAIANLVMWWLANNYA